MPRFELYWPEGAFERAMVVGGMAVALCVAAVLVAVALNFLLVGGCPKPGGVRRSPVATGTMLLFVVGFWFLVRLRIGVLPLDESVRWLLLVVGLPLIITGAVTNVAGRFALGRNWADQATLYADQELVTDGIYGVVRHPLYASLVWMMLGSALLYANVAALAAALLVFVPMMVWRARLEERMLGERFPAYAAYQRAVGMLIPRLRNRYGETTAAWQVAFLALGIAAGAVADSLLLRGAPLTTGALWPTLALPGALAAGKAAVLLVLVPTRIRTLGYGIALEGVATVVFLLWAVAWAPWAIGG